MGFLSLRSITITLRIFQRFAKNAAPAVIIENLAPTFPRVCYELCIRIALQSVRIHKT
jgi:hypothetical protein